MGDGVRWIEVAPPGAETSITLVTWFEGMPAGSVDGVVEEQPWGRFVTFRDPDGNRFVLQSPPPPGV